MISLSLSANIDRFRYNHTVNHGDRFQFVPEQILATPMSRFPETWDEYFRRRATSEYGMRMMLPAEFFPSATFLLSQVSLCYFLSPTAATVRMPNTCCS